MDTVFPQLNAGELMALVLWLYAAAQKSSPPTFRNSSQKIQNATVCNDKQEFLHPE